MQKSALVIRHLAFEDLWAFGPVLERSGFAVEYVEAGLTDPGALDPLAPDLLVVLGGPVGAADTHLYPFLGTERALLRQRIEAGLPTLGICLGAQLMALALGGTVTMGPMKEIGLYPLTFTEEGRRSCLGVFEGMPVLHWHGDGIGLPDGAVRLASTEAFPNQAFSIGSHALGVQFHPEAGGPGFERWLIGHAIELAEAGIDVPALRAAYQGASAALAAKAERCLLTWLAEVVPDAAPDHEAANSGTDSSAC